MASSRLLRAQIAKYDKVVNIPNSMTVLPEMMPIALEMARRGLTGVYNFTNPGVVSHNEILQMYKDYYDPAFTWQNFSLEEQAKASGARARAARQRPSRPLSLRDDRRGSPPCPHPALIATARLRHHPPCLGLAS